MPAVFQSKNVKIPYTYKAYKRDEITRAWKTFANVNKRDIDGDKRYVICRANSETEALILTAMMLRETDLPPAATYYDLELKKLYICCDYKDDEQIEALVNACTEVISVFMGLVTLEEVKNDWRGEPLFWDPDGAAEHFHQNREFPHGSPQKDYGGLKKPIHSRIPPEFAGLI